MPTSLVRRLPPPAPYHRDVLSPAAALTLAVVGTAAAALTVARLTRTLAGQRVAGPPEPPSLVWEG